MDYKDAPVTPVPEYEYGWRGWLDSPAGRYLLAWEQQQCDRLVDEVVGFYAVQCGLPELDGLRHSRISRRIQAWSPRDGLPGADGADPADLAEPVDDEEYRAADQDEEAAERHGLSEARGAGTATPAPRLAPGRPPP